MARSRHSIEQKLSALRMIEAETYTWKEIMEAHDVSKDALRVWKVKFDTDGIDALKESKTWKLYTKEQKLAAVRDYLDGFTKMEVLSKHQISDWSVLRRWIKKYTSHSELTDSRKGMDRAMAKGRKTTFEERMEIVRYCLDNGRNYQRTAEMFAVSYQQVYGWTKKYDADGVHGLEDRRGRTKQEEELTNEEKLERRIQQIERENERLRAENLMNREFSASRPDEKWCTDVTEFKYGAGRKAYLSAIIDLYDGSIVAYRVGKSNNNGLVFQTMMPAIAGLRTGAGPMIHSDRGYQYTSRGFKRIVEDAGLTHSMSRVGRCLDNAPIEGFWGTLKVEMYYLREFQAYSELTSAIETYISFYNHDRFQKRLNGLSPVEYRSQAA
ncbi:IS3 family transposase [Exiguobacterium sp. AT1b]|uniref:IS3 family transposase n=1 Tax=Exiguobacterium sp. (strain ATCC BAA-1283 / AT1b) TaxID=360911 RepID=UPI0009390434|nr:IS3 family transposase [Exiguobacterium sp. AT1b]